ncbi:ChaN family lipoprotein [Thalassospira sp. TSL5-1]|uniref:ChaN family lipoprotein n=1 Tax=Thalassospira sp. TSL5-1 TaxID=1544451 RepID=UPI00093F9F7B|nr:ChaN family lipoprotein [Thalassospira sp. TSL5-1]
MPTIYNKPQAGKTGWPFFVCLLIVFCIGVAGRSWANSSYFGPMSPTPGLIFDVAKNEYVRLETLQSAAAGAKYILLGESHTNLVHHQRQAELVDLLSGDGIKRAVVWEMINRDQQEALDAAWDNPDLEIEDLGAAIGWEDSGWPSWHDYSPIAQAARNHQLPMVAGNLPNALLGPMMKKGTVALPASLAKKLVLPPLPDNIKTLFDQEIVDAHCGMLKPNQAPPFSTIQFARDASLARAMFDAKHQKGIKGAFLIAGAMHVRANVAVPWHLKRFDPKATSIVIAMIEAPDLSVSSAKPADFPKMFGPGHSVDFIWFTSGLEQPDPCEGIEMPNVSPQDDGMQPSADNTDPTRSDDGADTLAPVTPDKAPHQKNTAPSKPEMDAKTKGPKTDNDTGVHDPEKETPAPGHKANSKNPVIDPEPSDNPNRLIMPIPPARPKD